jgi:acyl carrier protein
MTQDTLMTQSPLQFQTEVLEGIVRRFAPKNRLTSHFTPQTNLLDDVGIDSPRMIDIVLEIEDRFGVTIDDDDVQGVKTFGELMDLVSSRCGTANC